MPKGDIVTAIQSPIVWTTMRHHIRHGLQDAGIHLAIRREIMFASDSTHG